MRAWLESIKSKLVAWGPFGLFLVGLIDGAGLPNPSGPDILLLLFATAVPSQAMLGAACVTAGSLLGSFFLYSIARKGGEAYLERHTMSPRGRKLREWFQHYGLVTVFVPGLVPIPMPLKLFVICAGGFSIHRGAFLATLAAARIPRYFALAWLGAQLGENSLQWLKDHKWQFLGFATALFAALFLLIRIVDHRKKRQQNSRVSL
jgi:membrane protein YqaA with SNARE-associated domain